MHSIIIARTKAKNCVKHLCEVVWSECVNEWKWKQKLENEWKPNLKLCTKQDLEKNWRGNNM